MCMVEHLLHGGVPPTARLKPRASPVQAFLIGGVVGFHECAHVSSFAGCALFMALSQPHIKSDASDGSAAATDSYSSKCCSNTSACSSNHCTFCCVSDTSMSDS